MNCTTTTQQTDRRPTSLYDALARWKNLRRKLEGHQGGPLDPEDMEEALLLQGWIDIEGMLRNCRAVLADAAEHLIEIEDAVPHLAPLWLLLDQLDAMADAAFAVEDLIFLAHEGMSHE